MEHRERERQTDRQTDRVRHTNSQSVRQTEILYGTSIHHRFPARHSLPSDSFESGDVISTLDKGWLK
jgi:hypothetical protein